MLFKTAFSSLTDSNEAAEALVGSLSEQMPAASAKLVFAFVSTNQSLQVVMRALQAHFASAVVLGATTSGEFTGQHDGSGSAVAAAISGDFAVTAAMAEGLADNVEDTVQRAVASLPQVPQEGYAHQTGVLLLDGLSGNGEEAALLTEVLLGGQVPLAGGAAGDDLKMVKSEVGLGTHAASDAIVVAHLSSHVPLAIGLAHDHQPISPPLTVTKADGSRVVEVDGRPAWEVWKDHSRAAAAKKGIDVDNLSADGEIDYLIRYAGALVSGDDWKVRAALSRDAEGALHMATAIPQGAVIHVTESSEEKQIAAAIRAAEQTVARLNGRKCAGAVIFDCACRKLILGDNFCASTEAVKEVLGGAPLIGFETYGEIALATQDLSAFHNTTTVLLAFPAEDV